MSSYQQVSAGNPYYWRFIGIQADVPWSLILKYNYAIDCFDNPYKRNNVAHWFRGKLLLKLYWKSCVGRIFWLMDWVAFILSWIWLQDLQDTSTCSIYDINDQSINCNYNSVNDYNNTISTMQLRASLLIPINVIFVLIYIIIVLTIFYNWLYSKSILLFSYPLPDHLSLPDNRDNQFAERTEESFFEATGCHIDDQFQLFYGVQFKYEHPEFNCHVYTSKWYSRNVTWPRGLIIVFFIVYCLFLHISIVEYSKFKNAKL